MPSYQLSTETGQLQKGFYEFLGFPWLLSAQAVRKAIARGVETGLFGYATGRPQLGDDGRYLIDRSRVAFERSVADDEIDLDLGFIIVPAALPEKAPTPDGPTIGDDAGGGDSGESGDAGDYGEGDDTGRHSSFSDGSSAREVALSFTAGQSDLYGAWNALANLAEIAGTVSINVRATPPEGYDKAKLENGVLEPLRELGLIDASED